MTNRTCSIDGCEAPLLARSWCSNHYQRWHKYGDPLPRVRRRCDAAGCGRFVKCRGLCNAHYLRWRRVGDIEPDIPVYDGSGVKRSALMPFADGTKTCTKCDRRLPMESFYLSRQSVSGRTAACRDCMVEMVQKRVAKRPEVYAERQAWTALKAKFGITRDRYADILVSQGGGCAICGYQTGPTERLRVDHDHACCAGTKTCGSCVRGLLCSNCNWMLGNASDDPDRLLSAAEYLRRWSPSLSPPSSTASF